MRWEIAAVEVIPEEALQALRELYVAVDEQVSAAGPVCRISGRCCRFREYGHELFLTALEAAVLVREGPEPVGDRKDEERCPWQNERGLCTAREARPLGCRLYFCDPGFAELMPELTEGALRRLRGIVDAHGLPWSYARLHDHLAVLWTGKQGDGRDVGVPMEAYDRE